MGKAKYGVTIKITGAIMLFVFLTFCLGLASSCSEAPQSEKVPLFLRHIVYAIFIFAASIFNLLDFGELAYSGISAVAGTFYAIAFFIRLFVDILILKDINSLFFVILPASSTISFLRYASIRKTREIEPEKPAPQNNLTQTPVIISGSQQKCRVGIIRESRVSGCGSTFKIYVDGVKTTEIANGGTTRLLLDPGRHVIGFGAPLSSKISKSITLNLAPGSETNIKCYMKGAGVEAALTSVDVCSVAGSNPQVQTQSNGAGCLIGLLLFLAGMAILGVSIRFFVYVVPIG